MRPIVDTKLQTISGLYLVFEKMDDKILIRANSEQEAKEVYCNIKLSYGSDVDIKKLYTEDVYYFEEVTTGFTMNTKEKFDAGVCEELGEDI